jgi:hypothetical protein
MKTQQRNVQDDYTQMMQMYRRVYKCKGCGKKMELDVFATTPNEQRWYVSQLSLIQRCPKCYVDLMRDGE